jgi:hypothetical protein
LVGLRGYTPDSSGTCTEKSLPEDVKITCLGKGLRSDGIEDNLHAMNSLAHLKQMVRGVQASNVK